MKHLGIIFFITTLFLIAGCKEAPQKAQVQVFSIGGSDFNSNASLLSNYGGFALRIDNGIAVLRMFRISNGVKTLELEQLLDSAKHPMAWITPRVSGDNVEIEFGLSEQEGGSHSIGSDFKVIFESPHLVGSTTDYSSLSVEDDQKVLFDYWILKEEGYTTNESETGSENAMMKTSLAKPVDFLLITVSNK